MRKFIPDGPEIPFEVLQELEDERLVIFCGAGISVYTGLPLFPTLVKKIFQDCGISMEGSAAGEAFVHHEYDRALHLLEKQATRKVVRRHVRRTLTGPLKRGSGQLLLHKALLDLSQTKAGGYRLVTTNFDDRFCRARKSVRQVAEAPRIGVPRPEEWSHITYLHGLISDDDPDGERLVLSSGDFGRAYLKEGWAAQFLVELFREYTVLFIGYSLNDPILRYMIDALASDMENNRFKPAYALAGFKAGCEEEVRRSWKAKDVTPIPFSIGAGDDYSLQDRTLIQWAQSHKGGLTSRLAPIRQAASGNYVKGSSDDTLSNIAWALSKFDGTNAPIAQAMATMPEPPNETWIEPIASALIPTKRGYVGAELAALPAQERLIGEERVQFTAPLAGPEAACIPFLPIHPVTYQIGRWMVHHRETEELCAWTIKHHCNLHPQWSWLLQNDLHDLSDPYRRFWQVLLSGVADKPCRDFDWRVHPYLVAFRNGQWLEGSTEALLAACTSWANPSRPFRMFRDQSAVERLTDLVDFSVEFANADLISDVFEATKHEEVQKNLSLMADRLTSKLAEAIALATLVDDFTLTDFNYMRLPSIEEGPKEGWNDGWIILTLILRDCFLSCLEEMPVGAISLVRRWISLGTLDHMQLFQRLSLFALSCLQADLKEEGVELLTKEGALVLWGYSCRPEVARYLKNVAPSLSDPLISNLTDAISRGPSIDMYPNWSGTLEEFQDMSRRMQSNWAMVLHSAGLLLPPDLSELVEDRLGEAGAENLEFKHHEAEAHWVQPPTSEGLEILSVNEISTELLQGDGWDQGHRLADLIKTNLNLGLQVVRHLARNDVSDDMWDIGLGSLRDIQSAPEILEAMTAIEGIIGQFPQWLLGAPSRPVASLLKSAASKISLQEERTFLSLWDSCWSAAKERDPGIFIERQEPVADAINATGGILAEALLDRLFALSPTTGSKLPERLIGRFNELWDGISDAQRHARVILASRVFWLHRIDPEWTAATIIPAMAQPDEAAALWQGMLWPANWDVELVKALEPALCVIAEIPEEEPERFKSRLAEWFASVIVQAPDAITERTKERVFHAFNAEGYQHISWRFERMMDDAKEKAADLWRDRLSSIIDKFWSADVAKNSNRTSSNLFGVAIRARSAFPDVIKSLTNKGLLVQGEAGRALYELDRLNEIVPDYDIIKEHPNEVLSAVHQMVSPQHLLHHVEYLRRFLDRLRLVDPEITASPEFVALSEYVLGL